MRPGEWQQQRAEHIEGSLLDQQDRDDWAAQRANDLGLTTHLLTAADVAEARAAHDEFVRRCKHEEALLIEQAKRQAYEGWLYERDAS